jgi:diguanylate cyclase (GGDEF)-like protein
MGSRANERTYLSAGIGASMYVAGAVFSIASGWMPHGPHGDVHGLRWLALAEIVIACVILLLPRQWRRHIPGLVVAGAITIVSVSVYFNGERLGDGPTMTEFFYAWPAVYVGYFFRRPAVPAFIVATGAMYAAALSAMDLSGNVAIRWAMTMSVIAGLTISLHAIRTHVNGLVWRLKETARTDTLTAMPNRRAFDERLELELARAARTGETLALLIGDVDSFKSLNDRYGHAAGDSALASIGRVLMSECRAIDVPARIGGEEFAVLLPATEGEAALITANRLRAAVSRIHDAHDRPITISFGVAEHPAAGTTASELLAAADSALYAAKAGGRDRAVLFQPDQRAALVLN